MAYATGNLPEAFNLIIATHVSLCDECRAVVESCDAVGGSLLEETGAVPMCAESLERALAALDLPPPPRAKPTPGVLPAPLQAYVGGDLDAVHWRPIGMGVKQAILPTSPDASARLLHIPAGVAIPDHSHHGNELTLVLQGAFADEEDRFARGDLEVADGDVTHTPKADPNEDCICLAVTDAPLNFKGWLPRVVQRFVNI
ncbi:ChrR family anti-sigma-E factor [Sulfitobacter sp. JB4-11]|uniref:ChrR family anti-sigma-E factor n=1 Tax=Sulfitobacter rhodophyticola TaxID=3238304 RepID=UPI003512394E